METFKLKNYTSGSKKLLCKKRNLEILVIERYDIPDVPAHFEIAYGILKRENHPGLTNPEVIICFCMESRFDAVDYEPTLRPMLVADAMSYYSLTEWGCDFDEVKFSEGFEKNFLKPAQAKYKQSALFENYKYRTEKEKELNFYEWWLVHRGNLVAFN